MRARFRTRLQPAIQFAVADQFLALLFSVHNYTALVLCSRAKITKKIIIKTAHQAPRL